jgi:hypothetical protein
MDVSGQLRASAALRRGKSPRYPLGIRLGGPQSWSGHYGEEIRGEADMSLAL